MSAPRLHVDWTRCDGHGLCASLVDGLRLDDWGFPLVTPAGVEGHPTELRRAAAVCPALALRVERG